MELNCRKIPTIWNEWKFLLDQIVVKSLQLEKLYHLKRVNVLCGLDQIPTIWKECMFVCGMDQIVGKFLQFERCVFNWIVGKNLQFERRVHENCYD